MAVVGAPVIKGTMIGIVGNTGARDGSTLGLSLFCTLGLILGT